MKIDDLLWRGHQLAKRIDDIEVNYSESVQRVNAEQQERVQAMNRDDDVPYDDRPTSGEVWRAIKTGWSVYRSCLCAQKEARGIYEARST